MQMQAENLRIYSLGYSQLHDPTSLKAAQDIHRFLTTFLLSPEGAFYTSQDADVIDGQHSAHYFKLNDAARRRIGIPRIDKHIYSRENGWAITALAQLYDATGDTKALDPQSAPPMDHHRSRPPQRRFPSRRQDPPAPTSATPSPWPAPFSLSTASPPIANG